ncbi:hypothetical protein BD309DRAFT_869917 [Dichomitus squalens]|uniref:Uncharacterized protein n=1 Tax=Dichomitus squalens TaxID=114155 RepID=A0A4Q9PKI1_9APHY|nr:hypothetical protein BD309DRAFT_869917 [Dichomitus squalens]TBU54596.1 hypothetical protein BD310DRAFT_827656 [Dichomitus squalens]
MPAILLPALLHGIFTVLCFGSLATLLIKHLRPKHNPLSGFSGITTTFLTIALLILFVSSTVYFVINSISATYVVLFFTQLDFSKLVTSDVEGFVSITSWFRVDLLDYWGTLSDCTGTVSLTINILIGDAIVWWRACVVWPRNWPVRVLGFALLTATFVTGMLDSSRTCAPLTNGKIDSDPSGILYQGSDYGVAATGLSLATNVLATILVAYKFWDYRNVLRKYVVVGSQVMRLEKALAMVLESGVAYCAIWIVVTVWQVGGNSSKFASAFKIHPHPTFFEAFGIFVSGALVHMIAIYPTLVIVLVAFDRSHFDLGIASGEKRLVGRRPTIDGEDEDLSDRGPESVASKASGSDVDSTESKSVWIA